jgi:hypothetical protein
MTVAVCIRCGAMKLGALTPCPECQFDPEANEDKAKAMVLTDHFLPQQELETISKRIKTSQPVTYPEDTIDEYVKFFEENPNYGTLTLSKRIGCIAAVVACIAVIVWIIRSVHIILRST